MSCEKCTPEVKEMCCVCKGAKHDPAPIPEEGKWVKAKQISDISGLTHGVGWCDGVGTFLIMCSEAQKTF